MPPDDPTITESTEYHTHDDAADEIAGIQSVVFSCPVDHAGTTVYVKGWCVPHAQKRPIVIVHDFGESLTMYRRIAKRLLDHGHSVFCFDLRGHGRSGRMLGHAQSFHLLVNDLLQVSAWVRHTEKGKVPIIVGQGIGSIVAIYFQIRFPKLCHSVVLSAPSFRFQVAPPFIKRTLIRYLSEAAPKIRLPATLTPRFVDTAHLRETQHRSNHSISAKFANELLRAMDYSIARFLRFHARALILCPGNDKIYSYAIVEELLKRHRNWEMLSKEEIADAPHHLLTSGDETLSVTVERMIAWINDLEKEETGSK